METIQLGPTKRTTTRLGFGCSSLMGALSRRASLHLLHSAYDAGLRHFDVAPMYGYGEAEPCLGELLAKHRAGVTVTTKYGIAPPKNKSVLRMGRAIAGPLIRQFPAVKKRLASVAQSAAQPAPKATFTAEQAKASLEASLTALRTDHIDIWLLHEATADDLTDDRLLRLLEDSVAEGKIGAFGVGSDGSRIEELLTRRPEYCSVLQYEWSVFDRSIPPGPPFRIHHRALTTRFTSLHAELIANPELCRRWSHHTQTDLADRINLAKLMLKASLIMNPHSVILFSSKDPRRIQANVSVASDVVLEQPALRLYELVQAEHTPAT